MYSDYQNLLKKSPYENPEVIINEMLYLDRLIEQSGGTKRTDLEHLGYLISNLPKEYEGIVTGLTMFTEEELKSQDLLNRVRLLLRNHWLRNLRDRNLKLDTRRTVRRYHEAYNINDSQGQGNKPWNKPWKKFKGWCRRCRKQGHKAQDCPENNTETLLAINNNNNNKNGDYKSKLRCYNCNQFGHFARDCPDKQENNQDQAFIALVEEDDTFFDDPKNQLPTMSTNNYDSDDDFKMPTTMGNANNLFSNELEPESDEEESSPSSGNESDSSENDPKVAKKKRNKQRKVSHKNKPKKYYRNKLSRSTNYNKVKPDHLDLLTPLDRCDLLMDDDEAAAFYARLAAEKQASENSNDNENEATSDKNDDNMDQDSDSSIEIMTELDWLAQWRRTDDESVDNNRNNNIIYKELKRLDHGIPKKYRWGHAFVNIITYFNKQFEKRLIVARDICTGDDDDSTIADDDSETNFKRWREYIASRTYYRDDNSDTYIYLRPIYGPPGHPVHQPTMCYSNTKGLTLV
jgi:hypothetical protein